MGIGVAAIQSLHSQSKPPACVITEFEVTDSEAAKEFGANAAQAVKVSGGKYLAHGWWTDRCLDGEAPKRLVMQVFDNANQARGVLFLRRVEATYAFARESAETVVVHSRRR